MKLNDFRPAAGRLHGPLRRLGYDIENEARSRPGGLRRPLWDRLRSNGMYADETPIRELLSPLFAIESLERFVSEAHLHCLCVARKRVA